MKKIVLVVLCALFLLIAWNASLIGYGIEQGWGQLRIVWQARPVSEVLCDTLFSNTLKNKLRLVKRVKQFAADSLGLNVGDNYETLFDQQGEEVMWVVTACKPFELVPKMWDFPVVGSVPYKGFFNRQHAFDEFHSLEMAGWDTDMSNPAGWSTLGIFDEPLLSGMLQRDEGDLANLIIHEMVHATIFVRDSVTFNENLASFIADVATEYFMEQFYGRNSTQYCSYILDREYRRRYYDHMLRGIAALDSLYKTFASDKSFAYKKETKYILIRTIVHALDTLSIDRNRLPAARLQATLPNNAYFMTYKRYQSSTGLLKRELDRRYGGHIGKMIRDYADTFPFL